MEKEKLTKDLVIMLQPTLHKKFKDACNKNYESLSNVVRDFIRRYVKENEKQK